MGLLVSVYRNSELGDCTNNGLSNKHNKFCVVNVEGPFNPSDDAPAVKLASGPYNSVRLIPVELIENKSWVMFGGNYAGTSDSRFSEAVNETIGYDKMSNGVVKIFDRVE